jgi:glucose 1-dehydrogenase
VEPFFMDRKLSLPASSSIGLAVAVALGQAGADVAVNYLSGVDASSRVVDTIVTAGYLRLSHRGFESIG